MAASAACAQADAPDDGSDSDGQWNAHPRAHAAITESMWKWAPVHADLAGVRCPDMLMAIRTADLPAPRPHPAPSHSLHVPLLI